MVQLKIPKQFCYFKETFVFIVKFIGLMFWCCVTCCFYKKQKNLYNEIVLITGGGQGLGKELAKNFAKHHCYIVLLDINPKTVFDTATEIQNSGGRASAYVCDVSNEKEVNFVANRVREEVGDVTILVNNAGIFQNLPFEELDSDRIKKSFEINSIAHFWTIRAFLPKMMEKNHGHIVCISSIAGIWGSMNCSDYCATKFAVVGMMQSISEEMRAKKKKIKFTTVCPLAIETGMIHHTTTKHPVLAPIYSIPKAASLIMEAIRREKEIVTFPKYFYYVFALLNFMPRKARDMSLDFLEYCRIPNEPPNRKSTTDDYIGPIDGVQAFD